MKQFYAHYETWEDYQNGMYDKVSESDSEQYISKAIELLSNCNKFARSMLEMIEKWQISTKVNLTNKQQNRKAWLGQAACCYTFKVPEILTRIAWSRLTEIQRIEANKEAEKVIKLFEINYANTNRTLHSRLAEERLF